MLILGLIFLIIGLLLVNKDISSNHQTYEDYLLHKNTLNTAFIGTVITALGMILSLGSVINILLK